MGARQHGKLRFGNPDKQDWIGSKDDGTFAISWRGTEILGATAAGAVTFEVDTLTVGAVAVAATAAELNRAADVSARMIAAGATLSATLALHDGKTIALDTLAGSVVTLPLATGTGARLRFVVTVAATSNAHVIKVPSSVDMFSGVIYQTDTDTGDALVAYPAIAADTYDTITLNGSTQGGLIGDVIELEDVVSGTWALVGFVNGNGTVATMLTSGV